MNTVQAQGLPEGLDGRNRGGCCGRRGAARATRASRRVARGGLKTKRSGGDEACWGSEASRCERPDIDVKALTSPRTVRSCRSLSRPKLKDIESITVFAAKNPVPLVASYAMGKGADGFVSMRIKMVRPAT